MTRNHQVGFGWVQPVLDFLSRPSIYLHLICLNTPQHIPRSNGLRYVAQVLPVELCLFDCEAEFVPLGMSARKSVNAGEFGYRDGADRVLCRLDSVQADFSKVTHETRSALLIIESTDLHSQEEMSQTLRLAAEKLCQSCAATIEAVIPA